ncbi:MAG: CRTAC1 family protein [Thermoanaerobaculia bacterium]
MSRFVLRLARLLSFSLLLSVTFTIPLFARAQEPPEKLPGSFPVIFEGMKQLESRRDPKCYASASRLEDFMYGTPLSEDARFTKTEIQKSLIRGIWRDASAGAASRGEKEIDLATLVRLTRKIVPFQKGESGDIRVQWPGQKDFIVLERRDFEHYSSIAYSYRAILAVQQDLLLDSPPVLPLTHEAVEHLRSWLDVVSLAALGKADHRARELQRREITPEILRAGWSPVTDLARELAGVLNEPSRMEMGKPDFALTHALVQEKLASFAAYNDISQPLFMRNLQVYFARFNWPKDPKVSDAIKIAFNESMIAFVADVLRDSANRAKAEGEPFIRVKDVHQTLQRFVPYRVNDYEDVIFFPNLPLQDRVTLESYDTDSFRDSGLHWRYLDEAIDQAGPTIARAPDPFAAELITEGVAQFGVLVLRVAGSLAKAENADSLAPEHIAKAFKVIQEKIDRNAKAPRVKSPEPRLVSSESKTPRAKTFFVDVTKSSGIEFQHRMADWLNRLIRSYLQKTESTATLTVPPAFGGGGVAADDLNGDGRADVLLVGGAGNKLYIANGDGTFDDVTAKTPLDWKRPDNTYGEPRQPVIADFDNDGRPDILIVYANDGHRVYRNLGNLRFEDVTSEAGLGGKGLIAGPATVCDVNNDGLLDVYIGYFGDYVKGVLPTLDRHDLNASPNRLFLNQGNFHFKDVTEGSGAGHSGWAQAMSHTDLDGDGLQDLIVGNDFGVNAYLHNLGNGKFEDVTDRIGTGKPSFAMNVGIADLNRDDAPDIYISNIVTLVKDEKYVLPSDETPMKLNPEKMARMRVVEANDLFLSERKKNELPHYEYSDAVDRGFATTGWSWGASFFDFDLDGDDDLYCLNGMNEYMVYAETPYPTAVFDSVKEIVLPVDAREPNVFFVNEGGRLEYASERSGANYLGNSRSAAYVDIDDDGDLDMIVNNFEGPALVYRNLAERYGNHWLKVKLIGNPRKGSNRDAIGARLILTGSNGLHVWREIHGTEGYLTVQPREQHFGMGKDERADLQIIWPNGEHQRVEGLRADRKYTFEQK